MSTEQTIAAINSEIQRQEQELQRLREALQQEREAWAEQLDSIWATVLERTIVRTPAGPATSNHPAQCRVFT